MDETYIKVRAQWKYLYRAVDEDGNTQRDCFSPILGRSVAMKTAVGRSQQSARRRDGAYRFWSKEKPVSARNCLRGPFRATAGKAVRSSLTTAASKDLIGSELFGHVRAAYTGATSEGRPGRFELAHDGALCLDEIGELPLELQPILLRVLEEGVIYRLGDTRPTLVDVRLVAMTNRNLREEVECGRFRRDLYYRVSVTRIVFLHCGNATRISTCWSTI